MNIHEAQVARYGQTAILELAIALGKCLTPNQQNHLLSGIENRGRRPHAYQRLTDEEEKLVDDFARLLVDSL